MTELFLHLLNISITAGYMILAVLLLRLLLKKAPRDFTCILWGLVALRLALPFNIESIFSLVPSGETVSTTFFTGKLYNGAIIDTGIERINSEIAPIVDTYVKNSQTPLTQLAFIATIIWLSVGGLILIFGLTSYFKLMHKLRFSVRTEDGYYRSEVINSPFIFGLTNPKIYLPFNLNASDEENILLHEKAHIARMDHITKFFAFILLGIYWFNPLVWVYYFLLQKDIEVACDQKVIKNMKTEAKQLYSVTLLKYSISPKLHTLTPIAFGEISVKKRVKSIMKYKKPSILIMGVFVLISIFSVLGFMTTPIKKEVVQVETPTPPVTTTPDNTSSNIEYTPKYNELIEAIENGTYNQSLSEFESLLGGSTGKMDSDTPQDTKPPVSAPTESTSDNVTATRIEINKYNWQNYYEIVNKTLKYTDKNGKSSTISFPFYIKLKDGIKYIPEYGSVKSSVAMTFSSTYNYYFCEFDKNGTITELKEKTSGKIASSFYDSLELGKFVKLFYENGETKTFENGKAVIAVRSDLKISYVSGAIYVADD